jgi:RNA polymerase sigma factor (sigma-70 family)
VRSTPAKPASQWPDEKLVHACLNGDHVAWSGLIEKYKNLIFSIPIKFGVSHDEANDIFQSVCAELLVHLSNLREPKALPKWLMQTSYHQCLRWKKQRLTLIDDSSIDGMDVTTDELPDSIVFQVEREQIVREAVTAMPKRCQNMVRMLFFEDEPRPYDEIAKELNLATGSIGFIRGRCLTKLRKFLLERGFH